MKQFPRRLCFADPVWFVAHRPLAPIDSHRLLYKPHDNTSSIACLPLLPLCLQISPQRTCKTCAQEFWTKNVVGENELLLIANWNEFLWAQPTLRVCILRVLPARRGHRNTSGDRRNTGHTTMECDRGIDPVVAHVYNNSRAAKIVRATRVRK